jgi:hypothetical protein
MIRGLTKKEHKRFVEIIHDMANMTHNSWATYHRQSWDILEREYRALAAKRDRATS